jgi:hypothetical protein
MLGFFAKPKVFAYLNIPIMALRPLRLLCEVQSTFAVSASKKKNPAKGGII